MPRLAATLSSPARDMISLASVLWPTVMPLGLSTTVRGRPVSGAIGSLARRASSLKRMRVSPSCRSPRKRSDRQLGETRIRFSDDARLAKLPIAPLTGRPRTVVLNPNGITVGQSTLANEIMSRAGLDNVAASLGIDNYNQVPLELVVTHGVEVLIVSAS